MSMDTFNWLYLWLGLGGTIIAGLGAVAYFFPPFRKQAIMGIGVVLGAMALYRKGSKDAESRVKAKWKHAEDKSTVRGNKALSDAKRDVASGRVRDPWDTDSDNK